MRSIFFTDEQVDHARGIWLPRLFDYAKQCRTARPILSPQSLSAAEAEQYRILRSKMQGFKPYSPFRKDCVAIVHSTPVGLLAAEEVFRPVADCMVFLLADEKVNWFKNICTDVVGGWYWFWSWTIHTEVPQRFAKDIAEQFPQPDGFVYWVLTEVRGGGSVSHELWKWDGKTSVSLGVFRWHEVEDGLADEWYE